MYRNILSGKLFLSLFLFTMFSCSNDDDQKSANSQQAERYNDFYVIEPMDFNQSINVPGTLLPYEQVILYPEVSGVVRSINFTEGEQVKKGKTLIKIDSEILDAELAQVEVELKFAEKELNRQQELYDGEAGTLQTLEQASLNKESLKARKNLLQTQISKTSIVAPFSGILGLRDISIGAYVTPSTEITTLVQEEILKLNFSISQRYSTLVKVGDKVSFTSVGSDKSYEAEIYAVSSILESGSRMLSVRAMYDNKDRLKPGSFVNIQFSLKGLEDVKMIPAKSIVPVLNGQIVWKANNGKAIPVSVNVEERTADLARVTGDVNIGDTVVLTGLLGIREGLPLNFKKD